MHYQSTKSSIIIAASLIYSYTIYNICIYKTYSFFPPCSTLNISCHLMPNIPSLNLKKVELYGLLFGPKQRNSKSNSQFMRKLFKFLTKFLWWRQLHAWKNQIAWHFFIKIWQKLWNPFQNLGKAKAHAHFYIIYSYSTF